jgi:hypothetical protein
MLRPVWMTPGNGQGSSVQEAKTEWDTHISINSFHVDTEVG